MIFLFNGVIFRFHVNFQGCNWYDAIVMERLSSEHPSLPGRQNNARKRLGH